MLLRDGPIYILARLIPSIVGFCNTLLLARILSAESYGIYGLYLSIVVLGAGLLFGWLMEGFFRWYHSSAETPGFMRTVQATFAAVCGLSMLAALAGWLAGLVPDSLTAALVVLGTMWAYAWVELSADIQRLQHRPARYLAINALRTGLVLLVAPAVAAATGSPLLVLLASGGSMLCAGLLYVRDSGLFAGGPIQPGLVRNFFTFGAPIGLTVAVGGATGVINRAILAWLVSTAAVGYFTAGSALVQNSIGVLAAGISAAGYPLALRADHHGDETAIRLQLESHVGLLAALLLPAGVAISFAMPKIATLLLRPSYHAPIAALTPWLVMAALLIGVRANYVDYAFHLGRRTGLLAIVGGVCAVVNLLLDLVLVPRWGAVGAAAAMNVAFAVSIVHAWVLGKRAYRLPLPLAEFGRVLLATSVMAIVLAMMPGGPGPVWLAASLAVAGAAYVAMALILNIQSLRHLLVSVVIPRLQRSL